jgi:hypothetical protein
MSIALAWGRDLGLRRGGVQSETGGDWDQVVGEAAGVLVGRDVCRFVKWRATMGDE